MVLRHLIFKGKSESGWTGSPFSALSHTNDHALDDHSDENDNDDAEYRDDDDEGSLGLGKWVMMMG